MDSLARHFSSAQKSSQRSPEENASSCSRPKSFRKKILSKVNELKRRSSSNLSKRKVQEDSATCSSDGNTTFVTCNTSPSVKKSHSPKKNFCSEQPHYVGDESYNIANSLKKQQRVIDYQAREVLQLKRSVSKKERDIEKCKNFYTEKTGRLIKVMEGLTERFNHLHGQLEDVKSTRGSLEACVLEQGALNERLMEENRSLRSGIAQLIGDMKSGRDRSALKRRGVIRRLARMIDDADHDHDDMPRQRQHDCKLRELSSKEVPSRAVASSQALSGGAGFSGTELVEEERRLGTKLDVLDAEVDLLHVTLEALQANRLVFKTPPPSRSTLARSKRRKSGDDSRLLLLEDWPVFDADRR